MPSTKIDLDLTTVQLYELLTQNSQFNGVQDDIKALSKTVIYMSSKNVYPGPGLTTPLVTRILSVCL